MIKQYNKWINYNKNMINNKNNKILINYSIIN